MSVLDTITALSDRLLFLGLNKETLKDKDKALRTDISSYDSNHTRLVYDAYDSIDVKAAAILQHVSVMIAVSGLLFSQSTSSTTFKWLFGLEAAAYVVLALCCLRLLMTQRYLIESEKEKDGYDTEDIVAKETLLDRTAKFTFLISIALIGTFIAKLVTL